MSDLPDRIQPGPGTPVSDEELLCRVARGDRVAFVELYDRSAPWLAARLRRRCDGPSRVEEIVQDTFLTVWRATGGFAGRGRPLVRGALWAVQPDTDHLTWMVVLGLAGIALLATTLRRQIVVADR